MYCSVLVIKDLEGVSGMRVRWDGYSPGELYMTQYLLSVQQR